MSFDPLKLLNNKEELRKSYIQALGPKVGAAPVRVVQRIEDFKSMFDIWDMRPVHNGLQPKLVKAGIPEFEIALQLADDYLCGRVTIAAGPKVLLEGK